MSPPDTAAMVLLAVHMLAMFVACIIFLAMFYLHRLNRLKTNHRQFVPDENHHTFPVRPTAWLAIRAVSPELVRSALAERPGFLISPQINGWVIVSGSSLPGPNDDVDECFRFLMGLSRQLGHVQFFYAEPFSAHHAWARLDEGCVTRAYAWTGETVWQQGTPTMAERELGLKCYDYGDETGGSSWLAGESATANVEKIPRLATRWSLDPATLPRRASRTDESSRFY